MSLKLLQLVTQNTLAFAKVISLFSQQFSKAHQSYQAKKFLKTSGSGTKTLEYFLSIYQKKEHSSLIPIKSDHLGHSNPNKGIPNQKPIKLIKIPSLLGIPSIVSKEQLISNLTNK
jgi:hypothetical protein